MTDVLDSCVAVKWYVAETDSEIASSLIGGAWIAPDLILAEVANALFKKAKAGEIPRSQTIGPLPHLCAAITMVSTRPLVERALTLALSLEHPVYDCCFLLLAERMEARLVTCDERLHRRCQASRWEQRVVLLRDWSGVGG